jgi:hypothetical protein
MDREIPRKTLLGDEQQPPRHVGRGFEMTLDALHGISCVDAPALRR